jgi:hypothetical protein
MDDTSWAPERKVFAAAVAVLVVWLLQLLFGVEAPIGVEGAIAVVVAYLVPGERR